MDISRIKPYKDLTYKDDFIFCKVTSLPHIARGALTILLSCDTGRVDIVTSQEEMRNGIDLKAIRTDVLVKGECFYDIEMQCRGGEELYDRACYYCTTIDSQQLGRGKSYKDRKLIYIMFLCLKDPYGKGLPVYTMGDCCDQDSSLVVNRKAVKLFFNLSAWEKVKNPELRAYMEHICTGAIHSDFVRMVDEEVRKVLIDPLDKEAYMNAMMVLQEHEDIGRSEGKREGRIEGRNDTTIFGLKKMYARNRSLEEMADTFAITIERVKELLGIK